MIQGIVYEKDTGRITMIVTGSTRESIEIQKHQRPDLEVIVGQRADMTTQYIKGTEIAQRPVMSLEIGSLTLAPNEVLTVSNIPTGTTLVHPAGVTVVDDEFIEWSAVEPGLYSFSFTNFPYQEVQLDAVVR